MTVRGNNIVENCRSCFANHGFGVRLINDGGQYTCPNCRTRYVEEGGFMRRV